MISGVARGCNGTFEPQPEEACSKWYKFKHFKIKYLILLYIMSNNRWIQHIRDYAKENNLSYACALGKASETYTKTS